MSARYPPSYARTMRGARLGLLLGLSLGIGIGGCRPELPSAFQVYYDLLDRHPIARVRAERSRFDLQVPGVRRYLGEGWSVRLPRSVDWKADHTWAIGRRSTLHFFLVEPRPLTLTLRCRPYDFPDAPAQTLAVEVGDRRVATLTLGRDLATYRVELPESALRAGHNELVFHYGRSRVVSEPGASDDDRALAVAWYEIELLPGPAVRLVAEVNDSERALWIPYGARVDHYFEAVPGSRLVIEGLESVEVAGGSLEVSLRREGEHAQRLARLQPSEGPQLVPIELEAPTVVRLALAAVRPRDSSPSSSPARSGLWVRAPVVVASKDGPTAPGAGADDPLRDRSRERVGAEERPNVVVYLVDTLRADRLGSYGHPRELTPRIDAFAEGATLFEYALAQSSWTRASVASLFTGVWPPAHGANGRRDALALEWETLAERLQDGGYRTAAFIANPNIAEPFGLNQGFDVYEAPANAGHEEGGPLAEELIGLAIDWLDRRRGETPFFLYLHTLDPHTPYRAPRAYRERHAAAVPDEIAADPERFLRTLRRRPVSDEDVAQLGALYDAEVAYSDAQFGALLDALSERELLQNALVIFLSDHGEEFYEHGDWTHARTLHRESVGIPLIVKFPGQQRGARISTPVQHADLLPTILRAARLPGPAAGDLEGHALRLDASETPVPVPERAIFAHLDLSLYHGSAIIEGPWKLIEMSRNGTVEGSLYNWRDDPDELHDLAQAHPVRAGYLSARLRERLLENVAPPAPSVELAPELEARLRALGYF